MGYWRLGRALDWPRTERRNRAPQDGQNAAKPSIRDRARPP